MDQTITQQEVENMQKIWGSGIVTIGEAFTNHKNYKTLAEKHVKSLYGYQDGTVLFKPTKVNKKQFRKTFESALSYFIGGNPDFPNDKGFALNPWIKVRFENAGVILKENYALAMGNYFFTDPQGNETKVEYTFGYYRDKNQKLKIHLHHSSLPYKPG